MHETLYHKLNSAIMAWYSGEGFFFSLSHLLVLGLGSDPLHEYRIVHTNCSTLQAYTCAM
jgi:hypothetical protein